MDVVFIVMVIPGNKVNCTLKYGVTRGRFFFHSMGTAKAGQWPRTSKVSVVNATKVISTFNFSTWKPFNIHFCWWIFIFIYIATYSWFTPPSSTVKFTDLTRRVDVRTDPVDFWESWLKQLGCQGIVWYETVLFSHELSIEQWAFDPWLTPGWPLVDLWLNG